ncbi:MAG TPA: heterodisulfide reductase-related iron-sulfur binding cluster [Planctomycetota bacterium]
MSLPPAPAPEPAPAPAPARPASAATLVDYAKSLDCIHCGLCLQTCPTFRLTGQEPSSPRGRIHLMRAAAEGRLVPDAAFAEEMDFCLLCRHCESVCPAGVQFGAMMEFTRAGLEEEWHGGWLRRGLRWLGFRVVLPHRLVLRLLGSLLRAAQVLRLDHLADRLLGPRGLAHLPRVPPLSARRLLPPRLPAEGPAQEREPGTVALLEGCVMPELHARVNRATARSLTRLGLAVEVPAVTCCGSLHAHNGDREGARRLGERLLDAFEAVRDPSGAQATIVTNSAGCGAHLKELGHLYPPEDPRHARAVAFAARVRDYSEVVAPLLAARPPRATPAVPQPVAWDDPCHLCHAQRIRAEPRAVLASLPGLACVELEESESCCGSAGIYSLLRPEASQAIFARKEQALARSGAATLVTANPGCQLQWESGLARAGSPVRVVHLAELVDAALVPDGSR